MFCPALSRPSPRSLAVLAVLCGCHRAEIGLNDLVDEPATAVIASGGALGGAAGDEATLDVPPPGGAGAVDGAGARASAGSAGREGDADAGPTDRYDELAWMLCRDPLDPVQEDCQYLPEARTCSDSSGPSWNGCAGACEVCEEQLVDYPYYFQWHPCCERKACGKNVAGLCHEHCPPPRTRDKVKRCVDE